MHSRPTLWSAPLLVCAALVLLLGTGCFARGGVAGDVQRNVDAPLAQVHAAVLDTLRVQGLDIRREALDEASSLVEARYADDTRLTIHSEPLTERATSITVQVGVFGNQDRSRDLLDDIDEQLGKR